MSNIVYFMQRESDAAIKIGHSAGLLKRMDYFRRVMFDDNLCLLGIVDGGRTEERELHNLFSGLRIDDGNPRTEWFRPDGQLIKFINEKSRNDDICKQANDLLKINVTSRIISKSTAIRLSRYNKEQINALIEKGMGDNVTQILRLALDRMYINEITNSSIIDSNW